MTAPLGAAGAAPRAHPAAARPADDPRLRQVARQMEGGFVQELYKAMRATVPQGDGIVSGGSAEEMFTGLMDQHLATETPTRWDRGLAEAIYRQLRAAEQPASGDGALRAALSAPVPMALPAAAPAATPLVATPSPLSLDAAPSSLPLDARIPRFTRAEAGR